VIEVLFTNGPVGHGSTAALTLTGIKVVTAKTHHAVPLDEEEEAIRMRISPIGSGVFSGAVESGRQRDLRPGAQTDSPVVTPGYLRLYDLCGQLAETLLNGRPHEAKSVLSAAVATSVEFSNNAQQQRGGKLRKLRKIITRFPDATLRQKLLSMSVFRQPVETAP